MGLIKVNNTCLDQPQTNSLGVNNPTTQQEQDPPYEHAGHVGGDEDGEEEQVTAEVPLLLHLLAGIGDTQALDPEDDREEAVEDAGEDGADDDGDEEGEEDAGEAQPGPRRVTDRTGQVHLLRSCLCFR